MLNLHKYLGAKLLTHVHEQLLFLENVGALCVYSCNLIARWSSCLILKAILM